MEEILKRWNSWWVYKEVPDNKKGKLRQDILDGLLRLMKPKEIIVISGVRRAGKSTLVYQLIDRLIKDVNPLNILYFNFDEPLKEKNIGALEQVWKKFIELNNPKGRKYLFLDEIQNVKEWERWVKKYYDLYGDEIKFVITGSNSSMLSTNLSKLLTGRVFAKSVYPLSFNEFLLFNNVAVKDEILQESELKHFFSNYLVTGGFPEVALESDEGINNERLKEYFNSILVRDVIAAQNIRETAKLNELAYYCLANISSMFSYNNLSKAVNLSIHSVKEYLSLLENACLIFQLKFFSYSVKESIMVQKPRKIYCIDNGLRNSAAFRFSKDEGRLAENLVFTELKRKGKETYYWKNKFEVDFVVKDENQRLTAINVSYTSNIAERETNGLAEFKEKYKSKVKRLLIITKETEKKEKSIEYLPLWKWLLSNHQS